MADVDDPDAVGAVLFGEGHLIPDFWEGAGVDPLVGARAAVVIEVVIDAGAAGAFAFFGGGEAADVAPVVFSPEEGDVVGHAEALLVIPLDFFIETPGLRDLRYVGIDDVGEDFALDINDLGGEVGADGLAAVVFGAEAHGKNAFVVFIALDAIAPEIFERRALGDIVVVPVAGLFAFAPVPFFLGAEHGLLVAGAHDDAVFVGEFCVFKIIFVEGVVPHGGPHVVAVEAEEEFEDFGVELVAVVGGAGGALAGDFGVFFGGDGAELFADPVGKVGGFVVEKDAAVFDAGLAVNVAAGFDEEGIVVLRGDIGPVMPGGDADLFGEIVDAVNGAAFVAAYDDEGALDARERIGDRLGDVGFPLAGDGGGVELFFADEAVDEGGFAEGADEDSGFGEGFFVVGERRGAGGDGGDVGLQIGGGAGDAGEIVGVDVEGGGGGVLDDGEAVGGGGSFDVGGGGESLGGGGVGKSEED